MAVAAERVAGRIYLPFGERSPSPLREQRLRAQLRGRLYHFGNGVGLTPFHPREQDGFGMEDAVFHALAMEEEGLLVGEDLPNETYNIRRLKGSGGSDLWGFRILPDGIYLLDRSYEVKSGKHLDVQETLGRHRSFLERTAQKPTDLLYLLQYVYPKRLPFPKDVKISRPDAMTVVFIGLDREPSEPMVDQKGRFPNIFYRQFDPYQQALTQPIAA